MRATPFVEPHGALALQPLRAPPSAVRELCVCPLTRARGAAPLAAVAEAGRCVAPIAAVSVYSAYGAYNGLFLYMTVMVMAVR